MTRQIDAEFSLGFIEGTISNYLELTKNKDRERILFHIKQLENYILEGEKK